MKTPTNIERFEEALKDNKFTITEELTFINLLVAKYKFISKSEYARQKRISPQGVNSRLKSTNDPYIIMLNKLFIIS
tara:strand:+ start:516 stop:746 length:231 start_codon:yes stop_codon:yes gene_type:complete